MSIIGHRQARVQFSAATSGWTFCEGETVACAARVSRSIAGAIGATGIVVPNAERLLGGKAFDERGVVIEQVPKAVLITETVSARAELAGDIAQPWRINVPRI